MTLGEKIYTLRKQNGLSQEQLAEALNVSRQSISKWEGNVTYPEPDKLIALSEYFQVSLDYLMKTDCENEKVTIRETIDTEIPAVASGKSSPILAGLTICLAAVIGLIFMGILNILTPETAEMVGASSMIKLNGIALMVLFFLGLLILGVALIIRNVRHKS
ncbi:MAG: helix-turn-helix transcriptional regulator [Lachnospiraceae bacterium]|nr:helix-turn-helix transcriptional regulator [Lachnospiraceae bacterium]